MEQFFARLFEMLSDLQRQSSSPMASLERSISAAHHAHASARHALAIAMAEETRENARRTALAAKASDLEQRAVAALQAGREDLAAQAAEAIASIATDVNASEQASQRFAAEVALARREVSSQRRRLSELDRGRRLARIGHALTATAPTSASGLDHFSEAEATLARVAVDNHAARLVREETAEPAETLVERMSDAGFGESPHVRASDVLARLRAKACGGQVSHLIESTSNA
jgi:phage shock protein A